MNKRVRLADEGLTNAHDNSDRLADDEKRWRHRGPSLSSCYEDASDDPNRLLLVDASDSEDDLQMEEGLLAGLLEQVYPTDPIPLHLPLCPNGQQWLEVGDVSFDQPGFYAHSPRFVWPVDLQYNMPIGREPIDYFQLLCPPFIAKATAITNTNIAKDTILDSRWREPLSVKEMMKYIGIRLATTIDSERISLHDQWNGMDQSETIFTALDYEEQYGMSKTRFDIINKNFALDEPPHDVEEIIHWHPLRDLINLFNEHRASIVIPGNLLVVDECMSYWTGLHAEYDQDGLPRSAKHSIKPKYQMSELQAAACAETGLILRLALTEGKNAPHILSRGTQDVVDLTAPWFGTNRTVIADEKFSSVQTLQECKRRGLNFIGCVKYAAHKFPKKFFADWLDSQTTATRGLYKVVASQFQFEDQHPSTPSHSMHAICLHESKPKMLIFNTSSTISAPPAHRLRFGMKHLHATLSTDVDISVVHRPKVVKEYLDASPCIDIHDRYRYGTLGIERKWHTDHGWHRLFGTILGIIVVDAFFAYRYEARAMQRTDSEKTMHFLPFCGKLAWQLIFQSEPSMRIKPSRTTSSCTAFRVEPGHILRPIKDLPPEAFKSGSNKEAKLRCRKCSSKTSRYCVQCSDASKQSIYACCNPFGENYTSCYLDHLSSAK